MRQWEYAQTTCPAAQHAAVLADLGRQGWELVSIMPFEAPPERVPLLDRSGRLVDGPMMGPGPQMVGMIFKREAGQLQTVQTWVSVGQGGPETPPAVSQETASARNGRRCVGVGT